MSQNFPTRPSRIKYHFQSPECSLSFLSVIRKRYLVEVIGCILLSASHSVSGNIEITDYARHEINIASHAPGNASTETLCNPGCVTIIDYQSGATHLEYSRSFNAAQRVQDTPPARWRHRYEIRLTQQGDDRVVFDHHGGRHLFKLNHDGSYSPADASSGSLTSHAGQYIWTDNHAVQHQFHGSFLTTLTFSDNQKLTLHYQSDQLRSVSDEQSGKIDFIHDNGYLSEVQLPDGRSLRDTSDPCNPLTQPDTEPLPDDSTSTGPGEEQPPTEESPERCDTQQNPVPGFNALPTRSGVTTLDARPASCQSYFVEYYGTVRGEEIEAGLEDHPPYATMIPTNRSFPIVDFINGNQLIVVRSRDLASPTYNNPDSPEALYNRLMRDGRQIQTRALDRLQSDGVLSSTENGRTTLITHHEQQSVVLHLLIRQNMASSAHWQQIQNASIALAARYGIRLEVIIIP